MFEPLGSIAPWYGAKRTLAPLIVEELGPHVSYWEPFCGSMAVLMAKPASAHEVANDLHGDLINLARALASRADSLELYERMTRQLYHETLFREAADRQLSRSALIDRDGDRDLDRAADFLICSWQGMSGAVGTRRGWSMGMRNSSNCTSGANRWVKAVESIPAWHDRLRGVTILNRDAFKLLANIADESGTAIYLDPPYLVKGGKYHHDFIDEDHRRLAEAAGRFRKARVVVSYYDHPLLDELYPNWRKRRIEVAKTMGNGNLRGTKGRTQTAIEVLLVNDFRGRLF